AADAAHADGDRPGRRAIRRSPTRVSRSPAQSCRSSGGHMRLMTALLAAAALPAATFVALDMAIPRAAASESTDTHALYQQHCQSCHGVDRLGGAGPALLPESLSRIKPDEARRVIRDGRPASQMAAYSAVLDEAQI